MTHILKAAAGAVMLTSSAPAAAAQHHCAERQMIVDRLAGSHGETFTGGGLQSERAVFEVWTSEEDGTWTILLTRADGTSCVMAAGTNWRKALASDAVTGRPS